MAQNKAYNNTNVVHYFWNFDQLFLYSFRYHLSPKMMKNEQIRRNFGLPTGLVKVREAYDGSK